MTSPTRFSLRSKTTFFLLACAAIAFVLPLAPVHAQPLPDRAPYTGKVTTADGKPLGGAGILLRRQNEPGAVAYWGGVAATDARGTFSFPDAEAGLYFISIDAGGYAPIQNRSITLPLAADAPAFKMLELATLLLKITDPAGTPLKDVPVALMTKGVAGSDDVYPRLVRGRTDANGDVAFPSLIPGRFDVLGVSAGNGYFDSKNREIAPGAMTSPWIVKLAPGGTLNASAHDATGRAMGGASLLFTRLGEGAPEAPRVAPGPEMQAYLSRPTFVTRDGDGLFTVNDLAPGRYSVGMAYPGAPEVPAQIIDIAGGAAAALDFKFVPPASVSVIATITDDKGVPFSNHDVIFSLQQIATATPAGSITPAPTAAVPNVIARTERRAHADANGMVVLYPVPAATYIMTVRRSGDSPDNKNPSAAQTVEVKDGVAALAFKLPG